MLCVLLLLNIAHERENLRVVRLGESTSYDDLPGRKFVIDAVASRTALLVSSFR